MPAGRSVYVVPRMKRILVLLASSIAGFAVVATGVKWHRSFDWQLFKIAEIPERTSPQRGTTAVITEEKRKVYPYSIVPGGARTVEEARRAMRDPAVRDHYAAVDLSKLRQVTLTADLSGYLSYRAGNQIYWTAKKLVLKAGETVYTDGDHVMRGRCLNRVSPLPMLPIQPKAPSEKTLNTPLEVPLVAMTFPLIPLEVVPTLPPPPGELTPTVPTLTSGSTSSGPGGGRFFPIIPIIPPIHRRSHPPPGSTTSGGTPPVVVPPITAIAPEPEYRWLMAVVLLSLVVAARIRARRSAASRLGVTEPRA
jgi:hypothetical protein